MKINIDYEYIEKLKETYGEAFYILDSEQFISNFNNLKNSFTKIYKNSNIAYSYKTNYTPKLCKIIDELGGYSEVVSEMELELALKIGVKPTRIIWNGPIKNKNVMEKYVLNGGVINIDSLDEFNHLKKIINNNLGCVYNVGIRCNFDIKDGVLSRFGFDVDGSDFKEVITFIKSNHNIKLNILHCHFAKRYLEFWPQKVKNIIDIVDKIGIIPERIDFGGGLFGNMPETLKKQFSTSIPSYDDYAKSIAYDFLDRFGMDGPELIIEPGTALVADCMMFIGTIKSIKSIRNKYFASILGSQKNINMVGINPPIEVLSTGIDQKTYNNLDIVGYTCIEDDVLYRGYSGKLGVGDTVIFRNCGSYSLVMKPPFILPNFPVLDIVGSDIYLVKRPESFDDIFMTYIF